MDAGCRHIDTAFQSTLSMRRATLRDHPSDHRHHISIHALHEESDEALNNKMAAQKISIHALHEESDENR